MRKSSRNLSSLAAAVILLLVLTAATEAEGIRLDPQTWASVSRSSSSSNVMVNKPNDVVKGSSTSSVTDVTASAVSVGEVREVAHGLPEFQEDYYVPAVHSPRHH